MTLKVTGEKSFPGCESKRFPAGKSANHTALLLNLVFHLPAGTSHRFAHCRHRRWAQGASRFLEFVLKSCAVFWISLPLLPGEGRANLPPQTAGGKLSVTKSPSITPHSFRSNGNAIITLWTREDHNSKKNCHVACPNIIRYLLARLCAQSLTCLPHRDGLVEGWGEGEAASPGLHCQL